MTPYYADDWLTVCGGDCREVMAGMEPESVHCVVTSPPYWGLRDYGTPGQLGLEPTPEEYVANLVDVFREVRRVLRADGTVWLNLGDSYTSGGRKTRDPGQSKIHPALENWQGGRADNPAGLKDKDLVGIPWRVAFALQADGWYLRSDIIWAKPNPMPESVTDRPTKAHEYLFLLSKSPRYFYDAAAIAEGAEYSGPNGAQHSPYGQGFTRRSDKQREMAESGSASTQRRMAGFNDRWDAAEAARRPTPVESLQIAMDMGISADVTEFIAKNNPTWEERKAAGATAGNVGVSETYQNGVHGDGLPHDLGDGLTRNRRSVWTISTVPYPGAHFAVFPEKLVEPCILAGTSERGVCPVCGAPWARTLDRTPNPSKWANVGRDLSDGTAKTGNPQTSIGLHRNGGNAEGPRPVTTGWEPRCGCGPAFDDPTVDWNAEDLPRPLPIGAIVLDPFAGSGTVGRVANRLSRRAVLIDLNPDYLTQQMARNRDIPLGLGA